MPSIGNAIWVKTAGLSIYWDMQYIGTASVTPISGQSFFLIPEIVN